MQLKKASMMAVLACVGLAFPIVAQDAKPKPATPPAKPTTPALQPKVTPAPKPIPAGVQPGVPGDGHNHGVNVQSSDPALSPLEWSSMEHHFGNIPDTAPVTHVFKFTNKTDKRVTIQSATGSCGCTVPELKKKVFEPGESGDMTVTFNPQHRKGPQPKQITVIYAEPANTPNTMLKIDSNVQPLLIIDPMKTYLMDVDSKIGKATELTVSGRKADFKVLSVESRNPNVTVTVGEKREVPIDGQNFQQYPISVVVKPGAPIGELQSELIIRTNEETSPTQNYVFVADVVGELKATPTKLSLRAYTPNIPFANVVTLEARSGKEFKITAVDVAGRDDMQLVADFEPNNLTGKPAYTIRLNGVTPDFTGPVSGEIIVHTDLPDNPEIRLPFTTSIRGSGASKVSAQTSH